MPQTQDTIQNKNIPNSVFNKIFEFSDTKTLFNLRLANHFLNEIATFALFKRQYHYHGAVNTDKLFQMAINHGNKTLSADIIDESFNMPLRYVDQKEQFLLGYTGRFIDKTYQDKLDEIKLDEQIGYIEGYYPLRVLQRLTAFLPQISQQKLLRILNLALTKGYHHVRKKEFNEFKALLMPFLNKLNADNRAFFFKTWQQKETDDQMQSLIYDLENANIDLPLTEKKHSSIEELLVKLKTTHYPIKYLTKLEKRASELTQEQLLDFVKTDVPHMETADERTRILTLLAGFAKYLDPEHQEHMLNYVGELLYDEDEQCFTIARTIAPYLTENDVSALIDFGVSKLLRCYKYEERKDWAADRLIDFCFTLDLLKDKIPVNKSLALFNMFKFMVENNGFVEYCMNTGLRQSITQLGQYFNEESLNLFINFVEQYLQSPTRDNSSVNIIIQVLTDVIPGRLTDEQFTKLFTLQGDILFNLHFSYSKGLVQFYLDALALRLSSEQMASVKQIMVNIFNYMVNETLSSAQKTANEIQLDKKTAENICHYILILGKAAYYFNRQDVKDYLQTASKFYQSMSHEQIDEFFNLIPELHRHADEEDRQTLYDFMFKFGAKHLYDPFVVIEKIGKELPYDLLQHYLQQLMSIKVPCKAAQIPDHDMTLVFFKMIPLLNRNDNLQLLSYLVKQAHTQDNFDLSALIFQMLKHNKCNTDDLAKTDISSLEWGAKMIKVVKLYEVVAPTNDHFTLFKKQPIPAQLIDEEEKYKKDLEKYMSLPICSII